VRLAITAVLVVGLGHGLIGTAYADSTAARADQLFRRGKRLLAQKNYPEACRAFEQSDKLDPGIGAKLNVAKCYQEWGKLATAWRWYLDAENMATGARDDRAKKIHALVEELDPTVPRLTVKAPPGANLDGVLVKLDGAAFEITGLGIAQRVDPGPHEVETTIAGVRQNKVVPVERGGAAEIVLEVPTVADKRATGARPPATRTAGTAPAAPAAGEQTPRDPGRTRRLVGLGVAGAGAIAMGIAGLVTLSARSDYRAALAKDCQGATDLCNADGLAVTHSALHRANVATVVTLTGLVAVAGGLIAGLTAPKAPRASEHALYLAPSVGADGGTLVFGGAF